MIELQRDLAQMQDQVRTLQRSQDEKFAAIQSARPAGGRCG